MPGAWHFLQNGNKCHSILPYIFQGKLDQVIDLTNLTSPELEGEYKHKSISSHSSIFLFICRTSPAWGGNAAKLFWLWCESVRPLYFDKSPLFSTPVWYRFTLQPKYRKKGKAKVRDKGPPSEPEEPKEKLREELETILVLSESSKECVSFNCWLCSKCYVLI